MEEYYRAALCLDLDKVPKERINAARGRWREAVLGDPTVLYSRLGPQIRCAVPACSVRPVALRRPRKLVFDVNTVEERVLRMIPGISDEEVVRWQAARGRQPFRSAEDFTTRVRLRAQVLAELNLNS